MNYYAGRKKVENCLSYFADFVKDYLAQNRLTFKAFSAVTNISATVISDWVQKKYLPNMETLIKLANYLGVSVDFLLGLPQIGDYKPPTAPASFNQRFLQLLHGDEEHNPLSLYKVAKTCGIGNSAISKWSKSPQLPKTDTIIILADLLGCSVDYLVGRTD